MVFSFIKGGSYEKTFHNYNAYDMLSSINEAIRTYYDKDAWKDVQNRAMATDFSWKVQAGEYEKLYNK
jgi:starch synthase